MKQNINKVIESAVIAIFVTLTVPFAIANAAGTAAPDTKISISQGDLHLGGAPTTVSSGSVSTLLNAIYLVAGITSVIVIIVGGIRYAAANGDSSQIQAAKNMITYAIVGLVVIIMAAAITSFVISSIGAGK